MQQRLTTRHLKTRNFDIIKINALFGFKLITLALLLVLTGCGFSLRGTTYQIPEELKTIELFSNDPNGPLSRTLRNELRLNNVTLIASSDNLTKNGKQDQFIHPRFGVVTTTESRDTASIFMNGKSAEYQLNLEVTAHLIVAEKGIFPMTVRIHRTFFDNPLAAMQKNSEQEIIRQEMRQQAAQELVRRLSAFRIESINTEATILP
ncbi:LPS assembly lipoprotein LptE [Thorsellia anophelis]|uniref:LPS-assembly lipoprotein LptE n=1 Tax=Thorsellia anophelis DSM 18579 TaxID=1123402 RepID=A0A1I0BNY7_9GAMM|nr:LPS assembly lipoprotein LptE [Thorsellia anophelis]SET08738.1 LPS-assembly lipoprotein [Thorsellia anophelis DSM 18579]